MEKKKTIITCLVALLVFCSFTLGCASEEASEGNYVSTQPETISGEKDFSVEGYTLLETLYEDVDSDGEEERIEMYTSAVLAPDGLMRWDTGHYWMLLVRKGETVFPIINGWLQHGDMQFWVVATNKEDIKSPETTDLQRDIYVALFETNFRLFICKWNENKMAFEKEIALDPSGQQYVRHVKQHSMPDPTKIHLREEEEPTGAAQ